jgi:hypothetical protein
LREEEDEQERKMRLRDNLNDLHHMANEIKKAKYALKNEKGGS